MYEGSHGMNTEAIVGCFEPGCMGPRTDKVGDALRYSHRVGDAQGEPDIYVRRAFVLDCQVLVLIRSDADC